jgi:opacity protein-like surface antigen
MPGRRVLIPASALALTAALAAAAPPAKSRAPEPRPDLFGGYSYTHAGEAGLNGWSLVGSHPFRGALSFVADLSSGRPGSRLRPFAEGLLGAARTSTSVDTGARSVSDADVDWGFAVGGGLDYRLNGRWSARIDVQLRLLHGEGATDEDPQFSVGVVYRFGH